MSLSRVFLYSSALTFIANYAIAKYCVKLPTCEELGYIYSADKYPNNRSIKCPFDTKKILILDYCQAYGLTSCDSTSGECDECIVEKADGTKSNSGYWRYTRCNAGYSYKSGECPPTEVDTYKYPLSLEQINEEIGEVECVQSAQNIYCGYKSCNDGWDKVEGSCQVHTCDTTLYPYSSCDSNGICGECKSGTNTKYSAPTCNTGWTVSGGSCVENDCAGFTSSSSTIANCTTTSSCQKGANTVYKCDACATDYELVNGSCVQSCALTSTTKPSNCTTATETCTKDGIIYYSTSCQTCNNGYEVSSGSCVAAACSGYGTSTTGCSSYTTCKSGTTTKYKCTSCNAGYYLSGSGCYENSCTNYTAPKYCNPDNIQYSDSCQKGSEIWYKCTQCVSDILCSCDLGGGIYTCQYTREEVGEYASIACGLCGAPW